MSTIYTIGHTKKTLEHFIRLLQKAGVDAVIDVRLRNTSQLAGFAKRDDLAFLLREGFGIEYEHRAELAPTPAILDAYKTDGDWLAYEADFPVLINSWLTPHHNLDLRVFCDLEGAEAQGVLIIIDCLIHILDHHANLGDLR